jgi:DNA (cytosine-5)-methyltransferase 1
MTAAVLTDRKPRLLDLYCGAGGCSVGYSRAGFEVVGVDNRPQPHYPFEFHLADALEFLAAHGHEYDAIAASPPCQHYTIGRKIHNSGERHPDLIGVTRDLLMATGKPWVIENVPGAPLRDPIMLCGTMFDLRVFRHRLFESSVKLFVPEHLRHDGNTGATDGYSTLARGRNGYICVAGHNFRREEGAVAMGIDWMGTRYELAQAIPPAYTQFVGARLMEYLCQRS